MILEILMAVMGIAILCSIALLMGGLLHKPRKKGSSSVRADSGPAPVRNQLPYGQGDLVEFAKPGGPTGVVVSPMIDAHGGFWLYKLALTEPWHDRGEGVTHPIGDVIEWGDDQNHPLMRKMKVAPVPRFQSKRQADAWLEANGDT